MLSIIEICFSFFNCEFSSIQCESIVIITLDVTSKQCCKFTTQDDQHKESVRAHDMRGGRMTVWPHKVGHDF